MNPDRSTSARRDSAHPDPNCFLYGVGPAVRALERTIGHIAPTEIPVLLIRESGTGKENIAMEIHHLSGQRNDAFLKFDGRKVAGQSSPAWLSEHRVDSASSGTVFFDEISQLTPTSQDQLLRSLTKRRVQVSARSKSFRLISATARSLEDDVRDGRFHEGLYYAINGVCLVVPSLRNRSEDIPVLVDLFLKKYAALARRSVSSLSASTMDLLVRYAWPGNVRQLESVVRKIVELQDEHSALRSFSDFVIPTTTTQPVVARQKEQSLKEAVRAAAEDVERNLIVKALQDAQWNQSKVARELKIPRKTLIDKMKRLGLHRYGPHAQPESQGRR